jgi:hypothetical protein
LSEFLIVAGILHKVTPPRELRQFAKNQPSYCAYRAEGSSSYVPKQQPNLLIWYASNPVFEN